jgi:ABC transport system ATP-binding/permease protein
LPDQMAALRTNLAALEARLAAPLASDKIQTLSEQYAAVKAEIDAAEEEWLRLEMLREELETGR